jgi:hypothetical protein
MSAHSDWIVRSDANTVQKYGRFAYLRKLRRRCGRPPVLARACLAAAHRCFIFRGITCERRAAAFQGHVNGAPRLSRAYVGGRSKSDALGHSVGVVWMATRTSPHSFGSHAAPSAATQKIATWLVFPGRPSAMICLGGTAMAGRRTRGKGNRPSFPSRPPAIKDGAHGLAELTRSTALSPLPSRPPSPPPSPRDAACRPRGRSSPSPPALGSRERRSWSGRTRGGSTR